MKRPFLALGAAFAGIGALGPAGVALAEPNAARAETPAFAAELSYTRGIGAERCPDESALRDAVSARLGQDPFTGAHGQRFHVEVMVLDERFSGHIALVDAAGNPAGIREFEGARDCAELVTAMALAVSLAINPNLVVDEAPPAPAVEPQREAPPVAVVAATEPSPARDGGAMESSRAKTEAASRVGLGVGAFALGAVGIGPSANFGGSLAVRLRPLEYLSVSLEGRADAPATGNLPSGGSVKTQLYAGVLAPCWHFRFAAGCGVALLGRYHAESRGLSAAGSDSAFYAAAGGRLAAEYAILPRFSLQLRAELLGTLTPPTLLRNGEDPVWSAPSISGGIGLGVFGEIL